MAILKAKSEANRPELTNHQGIVFQYGNAWPHNSMNVKQYHIKNGWAY